MTITFTNSPARQRIVAAGLDYEQRKRQELRILRNARELRRRRLIAKVEPLLRAALAIVPDVSTSRQKPISAIFDEVCVRHGLSHDELMLGATRQHGRIRHEAYWRCCAKAGHSFSEVGRFFHKDHTTIMHGVAEHQRRLDQP